jgi:chemotaxis protein histidine kinase CheA
MGSLALEGKLIQAGADGLMIEEKLEKARSRYAGKLATRLAELAELVGRARATPDDTRALEDAQRLAHKICGSAGTFGFTEVGEVVGWIDQQLIQLLSGQSRANEELWQEIVAALDRATATLG